MLTDTSNTQNVLQNYTARLAVRFEFILFPIDVAALLVVLTQAGYAAFNPPANLAGAGLRITVKGKIARKDNTEVELNDDRGVIAVLSSSPDSAVQSLTEILGLIKDKLDVDIPAKAIFYEFISGLELKTGKNALEIMERANEQNNCLGKFGKILGQDVSNFSLKLVSKGTVPSSPEWLEITIEPNMIRPSVYRVLAIYRSKDKAQVDSFACSWLENLSKIIEAVET
jgi:hypothetical protein